MARSVPKQLASAHSNLEDTVAVDRNPAWLAEVRERLIGWYEEARRDLPWRNNRDAYRILVSEMMLVQTTVAAVIPYFERFLERFPDVTALAEASEEEVLKAWEGLGYYRRARQLQGAARRIVELHGAVVPDDPDAVRALPGVGRYIAGAVLSFAFDRAEPIVEANSQRVLARLLALESDVRSAAGSRRIWEAASRLVPGTGAGAFNQGLMDLGAVVCTPRQPACLLCPLSPCCQARRLGSQERIPVVTAKPKPLAVEEACVVVVRDGLVLIVQRGPGGLWEQFWEFPTVHLAGANPGGRVSATPTRLADGLRRATGIAARVGPALETVRFSVTNHRVKLSVHRAQAPSGDLSLASGLINARWETPERLSQSTFSSASRRIIAWLNEKPSRILFESRTRSGSDDQSD
jgi:A/G-specific adenine glycosylase